MPTISIRIILNLMLLLCSPGVVFGLNVLFVGNSFTYHGTGSYNRMAITDANGTGYGGVPALFKKFADGGNHPGINVTIEAVGGKNLSYHYTNKQLILDQAWDVVVLQEYSTRPLTTFSGSSVDGFRSDVNRITQLLRAKNPNVRVILYETWARPDLVMNETYSDLAHMQSELRTSYAKAAKDYALESWIPVGDAFLQAVEDGISYSTATGTTPGMISLWGSDNYHANAYGIYLSALMFYHGIIGGDPRTVLTGEGSAREALSLDEAAVIKLQQLAWEVSTRAIRTPPSSMATAPGGAASFSVNAAGYDLSYQWWHNGAPLAGATSNPLVISPVEASKTGRYQVVITSSNGSIVQSEPAALTFADQLSQRTFLIDFGSSGSVYETASPDASGRYWNQVTATSSSMPPAQLIDSNGVAHETAALSIADAFSGINNTGVAAGVIYPSTAQRDSFYVTGTGTVGTDPRGEVRLHGLIPDRDYTLKIFASREGTGTRITRFTATGLPAKVLNVMNNTANFVTLGPLTADAAGAISLVVEAYSSSGAEQAYGYLGVIELTETFAAASPFTVWTGLSGLTADLAGPTDDPDGDGSSNLIEYALGSAPTQSGEIVLPALGSITSDGSSFLTLAIPKNAGASGIGYEVEVSSDLVTWSSGAGTTSVLTEDPTMLLVRDNTPLDATPRRFMRVRISIDE